MQILFAILFSAVCFRVPDIVPSPQKMSCRTNVAVRLTDGLRASVACPDSAAARWVSEKAQRWFGVRLSIIPAAPSAAVRGEGYRLKAEPDGLTIEAESLQGVRYAMYTLRQAAEPVPEGRTLKGYWLPALDVTDAPALGFRGLHLCAFPELSVRALEHQIRLAAYYKYNYVVLESWGMFRSEKHPFLAFRDAYLTVDESKRLATLARDLGVTLVPQFNVFGHAAGARSISGKHVALDYHPERQPLFEPAGGWNWCLTNPETKEVLKDVLSELHAAFLDPPYVHIGCDEANEPSCANCRAAGPYEKLFAAHVLELAAFLRQRGARTMMWHDMLLDHGDPRWTGFYANGTSGIARALREEFPKDIVVCDWYYGAVPDSGDYPTLRHFRDCGFATLTCPWTEASGIAAQGAFARKEGLTGVLQTVWDRFGHERFGRTVADGASAAWGSPAYAGPKIPFGAAPVPHPATTHWRQTGWDMGIDGYAETGWIDVQVNRN